jgi:hypothetical protein
MLLLVQQAEEQVQQHQQRQQGLKITLLLQKTTGQMVDVNGNLSKSSSSSKWLRAP